MYVEGIISALDNINYKVKIKIPDMDNFETPWLCVPQKFTVVKKSGYMPELNALASAVLSPDMSCGAILGAIYNDEDKPPEDNINNDFVTYEDNSTISHAPNSNKINFLNCNINCDKDISDKNGTMQAIRDFINNHQHSNGNNGSNTGVPTSKI